MKKDYHKGYRLQLYITEELSQELDKVVQEHNKMIRDKGLMCEITKSDLVRSAIKSYLNKQYGITSIS